MKVFSISLFLTITFLVGCVTNPVTGKREVRLVGEAWELGVGKEQMRPCDRCKVVIMLSTRV